MNTYNAEMRMQNVPEDRRLTGFARVVTLSIYAEVLKIQPNCHNWEEFEERLLEKYGLDDTRIIMRKE
mgnify:CR=1 FL=1